MVFPYKLKMALEKALSQVSIERIHKAFLRISHNYRNCENPHSFFSFKDDFLAYLATRLPATYGAIYRTLKELKQASADLSMSSFLDLGAGVGAGLWAVKEWFPNLSRATLLEPSSDFVSLGSEFFSSAPFSPQPYWLQKTLQDVTVFEPHDLVLLSYVVSELAPKEVEPIIEKAWNAAKLALVVIEPGSHRGFQNILKIRQHLLSLGGFLLAPCPHQLRCPLQGSKEWCHFSERIQRSSLHRKSKGAQLGYEDEKFSYLIFMKENRTSSQSRIILRPLKRPGHVQFLLCSPEGLFKKIVTKKQKEEYRACKKLEWGDRFP